MPPQQRRTRPPATALRRPLGQLPTLLSHRSDITTPVRAAAAAFVLLAVILTLAYPMRRFIEQTHRISELRTQITAAQSVNADLKTQLALWQQPAHLIAQARDVLRYKQPDEILVTVLPAATARPTAAPTGPVPAGPARPDARDAGDSADVADLLAPAADGLFPSRSSSPSTAAPSATSSRPASSR